MKQAISQATELIDLLRGHPSTSLLPTKAIRQAAEEVLGPGRNYDSDSYSNNRSPLHYGPDSGNIAIRDEIGRWVSEKYGIEEVVDGDRICLTCGASYALVSALQQFTSPSTGYTKRAFMISLTYFLASAIFQDAGFANLLTCIPYPTPNDEATSLASLVQKEIEKIESTTPNIPLEEALKPIFRGPKLVHKRIYRYVLYCVPTFSNPTGTSWDLKTRLELVELARRRDILLISDDVYDFLAYSGDSGEKPPILPRLVTLDRKLVLKEGRNGKPGKYVDGDEDAGNTLSNCSFSKLLGPGLRCGWVESSTPRLAGQIAMAGASRSGGCPSQFASTLVHLLLKPQNNSGYIGRGIECLQGFSPNSPRNIDRIIHNLSTAYSARARRMIEAIREFLPPETDILGGHGGYFLWVGIGPANAEQKLDVREICQLAFEGEEAKDEGGKPLSVYHNRVSVANGELFECPGVSFDGVKNGLGFGDRWVRISVSWVDGEEEGVEGIKRLARAVERWKGGERATGRVVHSRHTK